MVMILFVDIDGGDDGELVSVEELVRRTCYRGRSVLDDDDENDNKNNNDNVVLKDTSDNNANSDISASSSSSSREISFQSAVGDGGWLGWHCEGTIMKTLFGLLFWDILFTCPCHHCCNCRCTCSDDDDILPHNKDCQCGSRCTGPVVFVTPFQDAPLDLGYSSFYTTR